MFEALTNLLRPIVDRHAYVAIFVILFICGLGVPIPEEITLLLSGYAAYEGKVDLVWVSVLCVVAILAGDFTMFMIARTWGEALLKTRFFRWLLPGPRLEKVRKYFDKHGNKTVFFARFFAGIRMPVYVLAGTNRMHPVRFLLLDLAGALISGPTSIYIAYKFSKNFKDAMAKVNNANHWILGGAVVIVGGMVGLHLWKGHKERKEAQAEMKRREAEAKSPPAPQEPEGVGAAPGSESRE